MHGVHLDLVVVRVTATKQGLADLRPNATIRCMVCDQHKTSTGAVKFHALHVCRDCAQRLQATKEKNK